MSQAPTPGAFASGEVALRRLLLPTAFQWLSKSAARWACHLARLEHAELHVLHVATPSTVPVDALALSSGTVPPSSPVPIEELRQTLAEFCRECLGDGAGSARQHVAIGTPAHEICRYVEHHGIDLVVMGTHGEGILRRLVHGSVSKSVVEGAACPVLLVPVRS